MNQVRLDIFPVESQMLHVMVEFAMPEYVSRAVAIPAPVSVTAIPVMFAVHVVVTIVPVDVITGAIVSIRSTFARELPVFPARSSKVKRKDQLSKNTYAPVFIFVITSLNPVSVAMTFQLVRFHESGV